MILVDTSVWIATFRRRDPLALSDVCDFDDVATCLPVIQEVLQGFTDERAYRIARDAMYALPIVESPLGSAVFATAVDLYRAARKAGRVVRSSVDCLIAACALGHNLEVLHRDRDFVSLAAVSGLRERSV
ncbi:MAG: PIN domain-containing protein [Deltaproteobacteria bacterium]|nr:PIN domain-containing protein [Deltaproteobacteria bacterium]